MQIIENSKIKEKLYIEKLDNDLTVMVLPKKTRKKYISWSTNFGSIDNKFYTRNDEFVTLPDGTAHYLEHKLFEQENGKNSLDVLTSLGVDANAYTTNDHTAYLYECTDNFIEALDEFMNYIQNPYFTEENVEKERGIIEQEIMMYDDYPEWALYMNAMKAMYKNNEINVDVAGSKESIAKITESTLYKAYDAFYHTSNMVLVLAGNFKPEEAIEDIKQRMTFEYEHPAKRIYNEEPENIVKKYVEKEMNISMPIALIGYKDNDLVSNKVRKSLAIEMLGTILFGKSSEFFEELYEEGKIISEPAINYEFSKNYAHVLIQIQSNYVEDVINAINNRIEKIRDTRIDEKDFRRAKKKVYGDYIKDYNEVSTIATELIANHFRGINSFEYLEEFSSMNKEYLEKVLKEVFVNDKKVLSVVKPKVNEG